MIFVDFVLLCLCLFSTLWVGHRIRPFERDATFFGRVEMVGWTIGLGILGTFFVPALCLYNVVRV